MRKPPDQNRVFEEDLYPNDSPSGSSGSEKSGGARTTNASEEEEEFKDQTGFGRTMTLYSKVKGEDVSLSSFNIKKVLGRGSFGKVNQGWRCSDKIARAGVSGREEKQRAGLRNEVAQKGRPHRLRLDRKHET